MKILKFLQTDDLQAQINEILDLLARIEARVDQLNGLLKQGSEHVIQTHCSIHNRVEPCSICNPSSDFRPRAETFIG
jgi:hypothetical protein